jgi:hypothetical protein
VNPKCYHPQFGIQHLEENKFFFQLTLLANHQPTSYELFNIEIHDFSLMMNFKIKFEPMTFLATLQNLNYQTIASCDDKK